MRLVSYRAGSDARARVGELRGDRVIELAAGSMLDWLAGTGREPVGAEHAPADVELLAPVPEPPSVRDFYAFEGHAVTGARLRGAGVGRGVVRRARVLLLQPRVDSRARRAGGAAGRVRGCSTSSWRSPR